MKLNFKNSTKDITVDLRETYRALNIILLSGGSGKRLWPLSNEVRSKQFLKIFKKPNPNDAAKESNEAKDVAKDAVAVKDFTKEASKKESKESMVQRMYRMIKEVDSNSNITIATSENQIPQIASQLGEDVNISIEPARKDTFPAIALAVAYVYKKASKDSTRDSNSLKGNNISLDSPVIICPVDPYVERDYFEYLQRLSDTVTETECSGLVLMGIEPTYPSEKYGYIIPASSDPVSPVLSFREKPDTATAEQYIKSGALWNAGVFAFKIGYLLEKSRSLLGTDDYDELLNRYADLEKISFDYAVAEKEKT